MSESITRKDLKKIIIIFVIIIGAGIWIFTNTISNTNNQSEDKMANKNRHAIFDTTMGTIDVELYENKAPNTTANFIKLAESGYYNGIIFHRVIPQFMVQTGDPKGDGTGGPGYSIKDEFGPGLKHDTPGILSMANSGPNSGGSQFFITTVPTPWLDGKHAIFGHVVKGQDVVDAISNVKRDARDKPLTPVKINTITIQ
jgi:peptidyl-prolyl cis-trans isomerase A (cyclophilin A)